MQQVWRPGILMTGAAWRMALALFTTCSGDLKMTQSWLQLWSLLHAGPCTMLKHDALTCQQVSQPAAWPCKHWREHAPNSTGLHAAPANTDQHGAQAFSSAPACMHPKPTNRRGCISPASSLRPQHVMARRCMIRTLCLGNSLHLGVLHTSQAFDG